MPGEVIICLMEQFVEKTFSLWSTVAELVLIIAIMAFGMRINFRFWVKLDEEKRRRPIVRKGNVIEPIASWFCILQMIYWPFNMLALICSDTFIKFFIH